MMAQIAELAKSVHYLKGIPAGAYAEFPIQL